MAVTSLPTIVCFHVFTVHAQMSSTRSMRISRTFEGVNSCFTRFCRDPGLTQHCFAVTLIAVALFCRNVDCRGSVLPELFCLNCFALSVFFCKYQCCRRLLYLVCFCWCSHISSRNQVRGHKKSSSHPGAEEYRQGKEENKP